MILRPIIVYAAPAWCSTSNTNLNSLQVFQNKQLRLILNADRYTRISELHNRAEIPMQKDYIISLAEHFYENHIWPNRLTRNINEMRRSNLPFRLKHKLPYQVLSFFNQ